MLFLFTRSQFLTKWTKTSGSLEIGINTSGERSSESQCPTGYSQVIRDIKKKGSELAPQKNSVYLELLFVSLGFYLLAKVFSKKFKMNIALAFATLAGITLAVTGM